MKIAVITAIFGGIDTPKPFVSQSVPCDRIMITEGNTPVPLPNLPPRLQAKYFKLQAHRVWTEYNAFVWIDGNIEITSPDFVKVMTENLQGIRIRKHHERQTICEEIGHILASESEYLKTRYGAQPLREEFGYYLFDGMPKDAPLYSCNLFAFDASFGNRFFFSEWWNLVLAWSWFDQSAFSYLAHKYTSDPPTVDPVDLGAYYDNPYFVHHNHDKIQ